MAACARALAIAIVLAAVGWTGPAQAEAPFAGATLRAPAACGTELELIAALERVLGTRVTDVLLAGFHVDVRERAGAGFVARVQFPDGDRVIGGRRCSDVMAAVVVVVATALANADAGADADADTDTDAASAPEPVEPTPPPGARVWRSGVAGRVTADAGTVSAVGLAGGATVWVGAHRWRAEIGAAVFQPRDNELDGAPSAGARVRLWTGTAAVCRVSRLVAVCAGGESGLMKAHGYGLVAPREARVPWWALTASVRAPLSLGDQVEAVVALEAVVPLASPTFTMDSGVAIYEPSPFIVRLSVGVEAEVF